MVSACNDSRNDDDDACTGMAAAGTRDDDSIAAGMAPPWEGRRDRGIGFG